MEKYLYTDNVFTVEGCISIEKKENGIRPWRIDVQHRKFYPFLEDEVGKQCSGVRIACTSNSNNITLELENPVPEMTADLVIDGIIIQTSLPADNCLNFTNLPSGENILEIWLDQRFECIIKSLWLDKGATIKQTKITKPRWVHYGSSISHSKQAGSPATTWAAITARQLGLHLTNLGFGGNCVFEPMAGRLIRDQAADFITLKLGINVYKGSLSERTFKSSAIGLIQIIRENHPLTPIVIISPIYSPDREQTKAFPITLSLEEMRVQLQEVTEICQSYGDKRIHYLDGLSLFGPSELDLMPDRLHPNDKAQFVMAREFSRQVFHDILNY